MVLNGHKYSVYFRLILFTQICLQIYVGFQWFVVVAEILYAFGNNAFPVLLLAAFANNPKHSECTILS